ncbi:hypothetical protein CLAFUW4_20046 [Fulvia fulva]|uniref:uncharacterized protein n=1 Tax=Passalora fulva TaxID=5499 RepID=UPI0028525AB3|nr:uncharacterized protein CLAFUR5_20046 [Fulvia fulva]KAK4624117.1 hypothetical protein CLAFUR4_20046 [Fulvia fulva]KAK4625315.1 hypothetical protein CLAFUR0_20046 [Fulvia fulva]WMI38903.1 hypothetical protein CLAFUR5_20046 [Fulvia fulva]WPV14532.1 hypothetical protein CLAFUW4_20046 [Fulvia fulva]WPV30570.1 hypothetical protein CLAFUW7_20046 [Fulvia fulva]
MRAMVVAVVALLAVVLRAPFQWPQDGHFTSINPSSGRIGEWRQSTGAGASKSQGFLNYQADLQDSPCLRQ